MKILILLCIICISHSLASSGNKQAVAPRVFDPTWESIDSRPLPPWYDQGKIGIFIHWGVYSVPSYINEWFWWSWKHDNSEAHDEFVKNNYKPGFRYEEFARDFTAEFFNPDEWAELFRRAGAKYVVLTSKHHDGYALWPNSFGFAWNSVAIGPHRDLVGDLAEAVRKTDLRFGLYYSLLEWYQSSYESDMANGWNTRVFPELKSIPTLKELVTKYEPEIIWSDGEWEAPDTYWDSVSFLAWLYNDSPVKDTVVVNDRWGSETRGKHGGFYNFDDRYNPGVLIPHKWENAMTIDTAAWTYRREAKFQDFLSPEKLIATLVETVACGGNLLVNVGPTKEGTVPMIIQERLLQMGEWLGINGEAIYESIPYEFQNDTITHDVWYTMNPTGSRIYAMTLNWPGSAQVLHLRSVQPVSGMTVRMLGSFGLLQWSAATPAGINVIMPLRDENISNWAWTVAINVSARDESS